MHSLLPFGSTHYPYFPAQELASKAETSGADHPLWAEILQQKDPEFDEKEGLMVGPSRSFGVKSR
jgi:hypothetical protein